MMARICRRSNWLHRHGVPWLPKLLYVMNRILFSAVVPPQAHIGRDVLFGYQGLGIVIHRRAVIGSRVNIGAHVTIGGRGHHHEVPVIGDGVVIGAGAKVLGPVRVGNRAQIGANAVVLQDVPDDAVAVGIPARILIRDPSPTGTARHLDGAGHAD